MFKGLAVDDFPNYFNFLGPNSLSFEASVVEEMELQSEYISQIAAYLYKKNVGSFRYAVMANEERLRTWTLSLREGQAKHPAAVPTCQSYYKVSTSHTRLIVWIIATDNSSHSPKMVKSTSSHTNTQSTKH